MLEGKLCNHKGRHEAPLGGKHEGGSFNTAPAAWYPPALCEAIVDLHVGSFISRGVESRDPNAEEEELVPTLQGEGLVALPPKSGDRLPPPPSAEHWDFKQWKEIFRVHWLFSEPSNIVESRMLLLAVRHLCRSKENHGRRILVFVDNLCTLQVFAKGRSSRGRLGFLGRKVAAHLLCSNITLILRWVPTLRNWADGPSRGRPIALISKEDRKKEREREEKRTKARFGNGYLAESTLKRGERHF